MELVLQHPDNPPFEPTKDMLVVVACEDAQTAEHACALLKRVADSAGEGRLLYSWWAFSVLGSHSLRRFAAAEAALADIVLIAAREGPSLPEPIQQWIGLWLVRERLEFRSRALVAFLEPSESDPGLKSGVLSELKEFAAQGALHFFANEDQVRSDLIREQRGRPAVHQVEQRGCETGTAGRLPSLNLLPVELTNKLQLTLTTNR